MNVTRLKYLIRRFFHGLKNDNIFVVLIKIFKTIFYSNKIDLDKLNIDKNSTLDDLFLQFGTYKASLDGKKTYHYLEKYTDGGKKFKNYYEWINRKNPRSFNYQFGVNYTPYYEKYLGPLRHKSLKILETGVANGHSIASLFYYFPNSEIHAVDIKKNYNFFYKGKRINYHSLNLMDDKAVNKFVTKNNKFDIIIENSLYEQKFQTICIKNFYPTLNPGGIYILEHFAHNDWLHEAEKKYNEDAGKKLIQNWLFSMREIFDFIKNKKMFKHEILKEDVLKYIFDTTDNVEVHYGPHPRGSMGLLFKKS